MNNLSPYFRRWPVLLGAGVVLAYFGHLLVPGRVLMVRDLPFLHLPLRQAFASLLAAGAGLPDWNPFIHGGQPILSNPHYAAWYPATWLGFVLPVHAAIHVSVLAHAALAFVGAWRLLRRLGASVWGRAFAAVAFAGGGFFVALTNTLLIFTGLAWLPWILAGFDRWLRPDAATRPRARALAAAAVPLGLQVLNGDPTSVVVSGVFVALLGADAARGPERGRVAARWASALLIGLALGAVQLVPTSFRLLESSRGEGLSFEAATVWSTRPGRLVDAAFPTFHGEAARDEENLYFGWTLNDRQFPLLISIYPGLLGLCLGFAGFFLPGLPRRAVWGASAAIGLFLALGRHNPLFASAHAALPLFGMLRYPEKFLLLPLVALVISAGLAFDRLVTGGVIGRAVGGATRRDLLAPLLASGLAAAAAVRLVWALASSDGVIAWMERACGFALSAAVRAAGLAYLRREALLALVATVTAALILWSLRSLRTAPDRGRWRVAVMAVAFVAVDAWVHSHRFNPTLPAAEFAAPELAGAAADDQRIFHDVAFYRGPAGGLPVGRRGFFQIKSRLDRLEPYSASLWGLSYALHEDYDVMLTAAGRHALRLLHQSWPDAERRSNLLAAWNVGTLVRVRSPVELRAEWEEARRARGASAAAPAPARLEAPPVVLERLRFAHDATLHPDLASALAAAEADGLDAGSRERLVAPAGHGGAALRVAAAEVVATETAVDERRVRFRARPADRGGSGDRSVAVLISAESFDAGWSAYGEAGSALEVVPTALGQIAVLVPVARAIEQSELRLVHRDPWVRVGAGVTLVALLALGLAISRDRMILATP